MKRYAREVKVEKKEVEESEEKRGENPILAAGAVTEW